VNDVVRFVLEAVAIIVVAVVAGVEHLRSYEIALCVLLALAASIVLEARLSWSSLSAPPTTTVNGPPWNVWELERVLRERDDSDEERRSLLHDLRDHAGVDGTLPPEFDELVRESFGSMVVAAG
jgi:hypothetical protein